MPGRWCYGRGGLVEKGEMAQVRSPRLLQPLVMKLVLACDGGCLKGRAVLLLKCCPGAGCMGQLGCWYCFWPAGHTILPLLIHPEQPAWHARSPWTHLWCWQKRVEVVPLPLHMAHCEPAQHHSPTQAAWWWMPLQRQLSRTYCVRVPHRKDMDRMWLRPATQHHHLGSDPP